MIKGPYIYKGRKEDHCYEKLSVDTEMVFVDFNEPLFSYETAKTFNRYYRHVHKLNLKENITKILEKTKKSLRLGVDSMKRRNKEYNALKDLDKAWEEYRSINLIIGDYRTQKNKISCELEEIINKTKEPTYTQKDLYKSHLITDSLFLLGILFFTPLIIYFKTKRVFFFLLGFFTIIIGTAILAIAGGMTMQNKEKDKLMKVYQDYLNSPTELNEKIKLYRSKIEEIDKEIKQQEKILNNKKEKYFKLREKYSDIVPSYLENGQESCLINVYDKNEIDNIYDAIKKLDEDREAILQPHLIKTQMMKEQHEQNLQQIEREIDSNKVKKSREMARRDAERAYRHEMMQYEKCKREGYDVPAATHKANADIALANLINNRD